MERVFRLKSHWKRIRLDTQDNLAVADREGARSRRLAEGAVCKGPEGLSDHISRAYRDRVGRDRHTQSPFQNL